MPLFRCEDCGCVENTALGRYWTRNVPDLWPPDAMGKALCSECAPTHYVDGTPSEHGKWHGRFPKRSADEMVVGADGFLHDACNEEAPCQK